MYVPHKTMVDSAEMMMMMMFDYVGKRHHNLFILPLRFQ